MIRSFCLFFATLMICVSCKKDGPESTDNPSVLTPEQMIIHKNWVMYAFTANPAINWDANGYMVTDIFSELPQCERDNGMFFSDTGYYNLNEGLTLCNENDTQIYQTGTWQLTVNTDTLILTPAGGCCTKPGVLKIHFLSSSEMILGYSVAESDTVRTYTEKYRVN